MSKSYADPDILYRVGDKRARGSLDGERLPLPICICNVKEIENALSGFLKERLGEGERTR